MHSEIFARGYYDTLQKHAREDQGGGGPGLLMPAAGGVGGYFAGQHYGTQLGVGSLKPEQRAAYENALKQQEAIQGQIGKLKSEKAIANKQKLLEPHTKMIAKTHEMPGVSGKRWGGRIGGGALGALATMGLMSQLG